MSTLETLIEGLSTSQSSQADTMLAKLFVKLRVALAGENGRQLLEGAADTLPATIKLKLRLVASSNADTTTPGNDGLNALYSKLIAHLLATLQPAGITAGTDASGSQNQDIEAVFVKLILVKLGSAPSESATASIPTQVPAAPQGTTAEQAESASMPVAPMPDRQTPSSSDNASQLPFRQACQEAAGTTATVPTGGPADVTPDDSPAIALVRGGASKATHSVLTAAHAQTAGKDTASEATAPARSDETSQPQQPAVHQTQQAPFTAAVSDVARAMGTADSSASTVSGAERPVFAAQLNPDQILKQIVQKFDVLMADGRSEAKIQLKPKYLGELKIHIIMEGGSMKAFLDAPSHQIKQILEANLNSLKQSLESQGLQVTDFDVSVGHDRSSNNPSFGRFTRGGGGFTSEAVSAQDTQTVQTAHSFDGSRAVNYLV